MLKLFRRGPKLEIVSVAVEPARVAPGGQVVVTVTTAGPFDENVESMRIKVECEASYTLQGQVVSYKDDPQPGNQYNQRQEVREDTASLSETLFEQRQDLGPGDAAAGVFAATFTVPADAQPTADGSVVWRAIASISVNHRMFDPLEISEFAVTQPLERLPALQRSESGTVDDLAFRFEGVPEAAKAGEVVSGTVFITPTHDLETTGISVSLALERVDSPRPGDTPGGGLTNFYRGDPPGTIEQTQTVSGVELGGGTLAAGQEGSFPFSLGLDSTHPPTLDAPHTTLRWYLLVNVARRLAPDTQFVLPIGVHTG